MSYTSTGSGTLNINHGRDQNIHGGHGDLVIIHNAGDGSQRFTTLKDAVAGVGASHDAEQQFSRGDCLPGTREQVIAMIHEWRTSTEPRTPPICWVSGAVGVGKTAIAMSVAKTSAASDSLVESFFFFRSDPKRNNPSLLFLSIAYGLTMSIPWLCQFIDTRIATNPRILDSQLEEQFLELVLKPSLELIPVIPKPLPPSSHPNLVIIDGLDECSDSETQYRVLSIICSAFETSPYPPLRFLICSRPEAWIREALYSGRFQPLNKHIVLDEEFHAGEDIEKYLLHEFHDMVTSPKYSHIKFPRPWPSRDDVACLVQNSCGQFVYVVTVVKWIGADGFHPLEQLRIILKQSPNRGSSSPYRPLDNLYQIILSAHPDPETLRQVLTAILFLPLVPNLPRRFQKGEMFGTPEFIEWILGLSSGQVFLTLRFMHSVLRVGGIGEQIHLHHTSFRDFLCDESRSGDFFLDERPAQHFLLRQWLRNLMTTCSKRLDPTYSDFRSLPQLYYKLWEDWLHIMPGLSTEVLSDLEALDLSALLTMALSRRDATCCCDDTNACGCELDKVLQLFDKISFRLKTRDSQDSNMVQRVISRLETVKRHFHIAVPTELATRTFLEDLTTWMSLRPSGVGFSFQPVTKRAFDSVGRHLAMSRLGSEPKILIDSCCTCPGSVLNFPGEVTTPVPNPDSRYAHFHANIPATCALKLEMLTTSLHDKMNIDMTSEAAFIVKSVLYSRLVSQCPLGDPRTLSAFRQFLSLAGDLKKKGSTSLLLIWSYASAMSTPTKAWLKTFSEAYNAEVREVWGKYTAVIDEPESVFGED